MPAHLLQGLLSRSRWRLGHFSNTQSSIFARSFSISKMNLLSFQNHLSLHRPKEHFKSNVFSSFNFYSTNSSKISLNLYSTTTPTLPPTPPECPEIIPAIPITLRPLIPGFYKTLSVGSNSKIGSEIQTLVQTVKRKNSGSPPLLGVFLVRPPQVLTDSTEKTNSKLTTTPTNSSNQVSNTPSDTALLDGSMSLEIKSLDEIYETGTLCSIVNVINTGEGMLTLVLYPHYRIRATNYELEAMSTSRKILPMIEAVSIQNLPEKDSEFDLGNEIVSDGQIISDENLTQISPDTSNAIPSTSSHMARVRVVISGPPSTEGASPENIRALAQECLSLLASIAKINAFIREHLSCFFHPLPGVNEPAALADLIAVLCTGPPESLQTILASDLIETRLKTALELLIRELETSQLQATIRKSIEERLASRHREALLMEQMRAIQRELGVQGTSESLREKALAAFGAKLAPLRAYLAETISPTPLSKQLEAVLAIADEELGRFGAVEPSSGEFGIIRTYLEWLTALPWIPESKQHHLSLGDARQILDRDHYGLKEVKQRILEMLAVDHLRTKHGELIDPDDHQAVTTNQPPMILLLVGPPGIGKSSIGASVARALGRPFFRFSLGGLGDVAEIKGHRRTYLGAMPGKIVQALKQTKSLSPMILLDEIDKLGAGYNQHHRGGDPSSALLEALDGGCGSGFLDLFLDTPVDLSGVFFMATANTTETIPAPLLDRMSVVTLSSYTSREKLVIAQKHILPQAISASGLGVAINGVINPANSCIQNSTGDGDVIGTASIVTEGVSNVAEIPNNTPETANMLATSPNTLGVTIPEATLLALAEGWCREPGVRQLRQSIERICRRIAAAVLEHGNDSDQAICKALGPGVFLNRSIPNTLPSDTSLSTDNLVRSDTVQVEPEALPHLLGLPPFTGDSFGTGGSLPPGVVAALAWTPTGGSVLHIEVASLSGRPISGNLSGNLKATGHLGKVMEESVTIAHSVARSFLSKDEGPIPINLDQNKNSNQGQQQNSDLNNNKVPDLHLHVPEGATPKDGPSAGVAMAVALLSLARNVPVLNGLGFTGELTLSGRILRIGGLKEKALAARREGLSSIIFPIGNLSEWKELESMTPEPLVGPSVGLIGYPVTTFSQVVDICFPLAND